jgi:F0F1-type ATP synthase assembly protein I
MGTREKFRNKGKQIWDGSQYVGVGLEFGIAIFFCHYVGQKIDTHWGTSPWGSMIGVIIGFCAGLLSLVRIANKESKKYQQKLAQEKDAHHTVAQEKDTHHTVAEHIGYEDTDTINENDQWK